MELKIDGQICDPGTVPIAEAKSTQYGISGEPEIFPDGRIPKFFRSVFPADEISRL